MFKSVFLTLALLVAGAVAMPQSAQAGLIITQQFELEDGTNIGVLSIDLDDIDEFGFASDWHLFELFGLSMGESFLFEALYDPTDLLAGLNFLSFDVNDIAGSFALDGFFDINFGEGFFSVFSTEGEFIDAGIFVLGPARITNVPEPASCLLFLTAATGLLLRRRQRSRLLS